MNALAAHTTEQELETPSRAETTGASLMTPLGLVEGEILTHLEEHGVTTLRMLIGDLGWPSTMVMMAGGALIRAGLARATQHGLEVLIEPIGTAHGSKSARGS